MNKGALRSQRGRFPPCILTHKGGCQELSFLLRWTLSQGPLEKVIESKASNHSIVKMIGCAADSVGL